MRVSRAASAPLRFPSPPRAYFYNSRKKTVNIPFNNANAVLAFSGMERRTATTRITGGSHRGRVISAPRTRGLRPTSERARAALFSIVGDAAARGRRVADLYAGTGALGIEALSRGAAWVDFVEANPRLCAALRARLADWRLDDRAKVYKGRTLKAIETLSGGYDLILADPPYGDSRELERLLDRLQSPGLLAEGGLAVLEHRAGVPIILPDNGRLALKTTKTYGGAAITALSAGAANG